MLRTPSDESLTSVPTLPEVSGQLDLRALRERESQADSRPVAPARAGRARNGRGDLRRRRSALAAAARGVSPPRSAGSQLRRDRSDPTGAGRHRSLPYRERPPDDQPRDRRMSDHVSSEQLSALIDGELSLTAREAVLGHLRECPTCAASHERLVEVAAVMAALPAE